MSTRVAGLTGVTLQEAPSVCHGCVWWQSQSGRSVDKQRWIERAEADVTGAVAGALLGSSRAPGRFATSISGRQASSHSESSPPSCTAISSPRFHE